MNDIARRTEVHTKGNPRSIPEFASEEEAREFWATHDSADYWGQMEDVTETPPSQLEIGPGRARSRARKRPPAGRMDLVSLRFPAEMIEAIKEIAAQRHLPYQTLMRSWIGECLEQQRGETMQTHQGEKAIRMGDAPTKFAPSSEEIVVRIAQLNRENETIMRERVFDEDSADRVREIREECTAAQSADERGCR